MNSFTQIDSRRQRRQNERNIHTLDSPRPNYRYLPESDFESAHCSNINNNNLPEPPYARTSDIQKKTLHVYLP